MTTLLEELEQAAQAADKEAKRFRKLCARAGGGCQAAADYFDAQVKAEGKAEMFRRRADHIRMFRHARGKLPTTSEMIREVITAISEPLPSTVFLIPIPEDCPACAKVARHPGEGYVCAWHPPAGISAPSNERGFTWKLTRGLVCRDEDFSEVNPEGFWLGNTPQNEIFILPEDLRTVRTLLQVAEPKPDPETVARPISEYHEDFGSVLWWKLPVEEPPYAGTPGDSDWIEDYYTHWTPIPIPSNADGG